MPSKMPNTEAMDKCATELRVAINKSLVQLGDQMSKRHGLTHHEYTACASAACWEVAALTFCATQGWSIDEVNSYNEKARQIVHEAIQRGDLP